MYLTFRDQRWVVAAPAKINLTLEVLGRRTDGYHDIETLIAPVSLCDTLSVRSGAAGSGGEFSLSVFNRVDRRAFAPADTLSLPTDESNLALRGVRLLAERAGVDRGADIELVKRIPWQAGLGGGSSDAAAALVAANRAWDLNWTTAQLAELGAELGSDVPAFFARGGSICRGRGEQVAPTKIPAGLPIVIVKPPVGLATPRVFAAWRDQQLQAKRVTAMQVAAALASGSFAQLKRLMHNSLMGAALAIEPALARIAKMFDSLPVVAHQLTGSGSAWFGVCRSMACARRAANQLSARGCGATFAVHTCL